MQRFSDEQLDVLKLDPQLAIYAVCPFCGGHLVLGHRVDTGALSLGHSASPDGKLGTILGCETFRGLVHTDPREFFRLLKSHGTKWQRLVG
jgi:hypothetical protein